MEMRIGKRAMTKIVAAAAIGLGTFGASQRAHASLIVDLRATDGSKSVSVTPGNPVTLELWAIVTGANASHDDTIQSVAGDVVSTGALLGNLTATPYAGFEPFPGFFVGKFNGLGSQAGKVQDLDADTDLDVGTPMTAQNVTDFFNARSNSQENPSTYAANGFANAHNVGASGAEIRIGTVTFTPSAGASGSTLVNFIHRVENNGAPATEGAVWVEDGVPKNPTNGTYGEGSPVTLSVVPEPTSLALAGIAGLGMLNRRRKNA